MDTQRIGVDYSELHRLDSPANRLIRESIWAREDDIGQQSFATLRYFDEIIHRLDLRDGDRVLDVGSGTGGPAIYIAGKSGCSMVGVEVNEVGVEVSASLVADSTVGDRVEFLLGDAMALPFDDASFDKAISLNVMNVFEDKVGLFREVLRVLKPGGRWAFLSGAFDLGPDDAEVRARLARGYLIPQFYDSIAGYKAKLREAGFVVDEVLEYVSDFRLQVSRWGGAYSTHREEIAKEQGEENTAYHIDYFAAYLEMIDAGKASNALIVSHRPA